MKKTVLSIALFSLVVAATSFANPVTMKSERSIASTIDPGQVGTRDGRQKADLMSTSIDPGQVGTRDGRQKADFQSSDFGTDSQAKRMIVKLD